jgi:hypothetical protein
MNVWRSGALKGLWGIAIALSVALGSAVLAQENTPVSSLATLEAGEFSALAITLNGERMLVADTANNTARLYDISDPQDPSQLDSIALEGPPLALAPTLEYAIAIIDTGTDHDLAQVIAPALFNPRAGWEAYPLLDVPAGTRGFAIDFSGTWGGIISDDLLLVLELLDAVNVNWVSVDLDESPIAVAITNRVVLLALEDSASITRYALRSGPEAQSLRPLPVSAAVRALDVNDSGDLAAAALENGDIVIFDPLANAEPAVLLTAETPVDHLRLLSEGDRTWLAFGAEGETRVHVYSVIDASAAQSPSTLELRAPLRALTSYGNLLAVSEGSSIRLFSIDS